MRIRDMTAADVPFAFACTNGEGWAGETPEVFETFLAYDRRGCFIAEHGAKPVGICVATAFRTNGFIGELVVIPEYRGKGIGRGLFERAIAHLRSFGIDDIYLDGDLEAVPFYERRGFRRICRSMRFIGNVPGRRALGVRPACGEDAAEICAMDRGLFGDDRSFFIQRRLESNPKLCFVLEIGMTIAGYVMARPGVGVISVGPWAAKGSDGEARSMIETLSVETGAQKLRIGVLETNARALSVIGSFGVFEETASSWRMVLGRGGKLGRHEDLFAIGSAAKG